MLKNTLRAIIPKKIWFILSITKRIVMPKGAKNLKDIKFIKNFDSVVVLGNGPSLKNDLEDIVKKADTHDFVCVNNFCSSPYYKVFKPSMYVFLDGYFFTKNAHPDWIEQREKTFMIINEETTWNMKIILPAGADKNILKKFIKNQKVEIVKVNCTPLFVQKYNKFIKAIFNTGFFGPASNNVLIYAIYYTLWGGYKKVLVYGADMTIYKNIDVDQNDNSLIMKLQHFNKEDTVEKLYTGAMKDHCPTMSEMMFSAYRILKQNEILNIYSFDKKISIENHSSYSIIDAYKRGEK